MQGISPTKDRIPLFVLEEKSEIPENEMAKYGYAPTLVLRQTPAKVASSQGKVFIPNPEEVDFAPSISPSELGTMFHL